MIRRALLIAALGLASCKLASAQFHAESAETHGALVEEAVRAADREMSVLTKAGGAKIGTITAKGNGFANDATLGEQAAHEAARNGGTHLVLTKSGKTSDGSDKPLAEYVVVRVPPENWGSLPAALRPGVERATPAAPAEAAPAPSAVLPPPASGAAKCAARSGRYQIHYEERSGTCGPLADRTDVVTTQVMAVAAPCRGTITYSDDNCTVTVEKTCPGSADGAELSTRAEMIWVPDASSARGSLTSRVSRAGEVVCESIYEVRQRRP